jgi:hypothetical protein
MDLINNHNGRVMATVLPRMNSGEIARRLGALGWLQTEADRGRVDRLTSCAEWCSLFVPLNLEQRA